MLGLWPYLLVVPGMLGHFPCGGRGPGGARRVVLWATYFRWANVVTLFVICPGR